MKSDSWEPQITPDWLCRVLGKSIPQLRQTDEGFVPLHDGSPEIQPFTAVTTDSRKAGPGSLFIALPGETHDGHTFVRQVIQQGARAIIVRNGTELPPAPDTLIFTVEDTQKTYRQLAYAWRREFSVPLLVVAGSVGKTTTKELLAAILRGKYSQILKTEGSQNGFLGIPLTVMKWTPKHEIAVIEVGIDEPGAMIQHLEFLNPTASLVTRVAEEHLEKLIDLPTVASEEGLALTHTAARGGKIIIHLDDPWLRPHAMTIRKGERWGFTLTASDQSSLNIDFLVQASIEPNSPQSLRITDSKNASWTLTSPLPGLHNVSNLVAAISMALAHGLTPDEIKKGLSTFQVAAGRSEVVTLGKSTVICDYYNANPASVNAGLELLQELGSKNRKTKQWACLGDMLELGTNEENLHRGLARKILEVKPQGIFLYGDRMRWLEEELKKAGFSGHLSRHQTHEALVSELKLCFQDGDTLLIKGSRGMKMETVWKGLSAGSGSAARIHEH